MPRATNDREKGRPKRVLSGMRPTGRLHLGHYFGALDNWVRMQEEYDCFYFVADWHALTTHYAEDTRLVPQNTLEVATDWLAAGLDPAKCTMFVQSRLLEHAELHLLLSMITPLGWLERVPTYKELIEQLPHKELGTYGFLGYPLLQAADIVMYDADFVPVGEDQVPHVELTREIVRRFNAYFGFTVRPQLFENANFGTLTNLWGAARISGLSPVPFDGTMPSEARTDAERRIRTRAVEVGAANFLEAVGKAAKFFRQQEVLREPSAMLTETPRFPGLDGRRMAKSFNNAIWLSDDPDTIRGKVRGMMTDPQRVRRTDPGRPEVCPVFAWHKLFSSAETIAWSDQGCRTAEIGCIECKQAMADGLIRWIEPIRARRLEFEAHPDRVWDVLDEGSKKAQRVARRTMRRVREAIFGKVERPPRTKSRTPAGGTESSPAVPAGAGQGGGN